MAKTTKWSLIDSPSRNSPFYGAVTLTSATSAGSGCRMPAKDELSVVGVDGCRAGWVAIGLEDGRFARASVFERFC